MEGVSRVLTVAVVMTLWNGMDLLLPLESSDKVCELYWNDGCQFPGPGKQLTRDLFAVR